MLDIIRPDELEPSPAKEIPDVVFEVMNELIKKNWDGGMAVVEFNEFCEAVYGNGGSRSDIDLFLKNVYKVRDVFRNHGWGVSVFDYNVSFKFFKP